MHESRVIPKLFNVQHQKQSNTFGFWSRLNYNFWTFEDFQDWIKSKKILHPSYSQISKFDLLIVGMQAPFRDQSSRPETNQPA